MGSGRLDCRTRLLAIYYYPEGDEFYLEGGDGYAVSPPESILESVLSSVRALQSEKSTPLKRVQI